MSTEQRLNAAYKRREADAMAETVLTTDGHGVRHGLYARSERAVKARAATFQNCEQKHGSIGVARIYSDSY